MLSNKDVVSVATSVNITLTEEEIKQALELYPEHQESDPDENWSIVMEQAIHEVVGNRPQTRYVLIAINIRIGDEEHLERHLAEIPKNANLIEYVENEFIPENYGEAEEIDNSGFWYDSGCKVLYMDSYYSREIKSAKEYKVVKKYLF